MVDEQKLRQLAEAVNGWALNQVHQQPDDLEAGVACVGGRHDDDSFAEVMTIDTGMYFAEEQAIGLANFYAAANPAAIISLLDELQTLREEQAAWKKQCDTLTHQVICCGVAASHPDATLTTRGAYAGKWNSAQAEEVRKLRAECAQMREERTAWWVRAITAEESLMLTDESTTQLREQVAALEAAVKQARIDALEEAAGVCDKQVDTCLAALSMGGTVLDKQFQKASFLLSEHLARRVRSLKGNTP